MQFKIYVLSVLFFLIAHGEGQRNISKQKPDDIMSSNFLVDMLLNKLTNIKKGIESDGSIIRSMLKGDWDLQFLLDLFGVPRNSQLLLVDARKDKRMVHTFEVILAETIKEKVLKVATSSIQTRPAFVKKIVKQVNHHISKEKLENLQAPLVRCMEKVKKEIVQLMMKMITIMAKKDMNALGLAIMMRRPEVAKRIVFKLVKERKFRPDKLKWTKHGSPNDQLQMFQAVHEFFHHEKSIATKIRITDAFIRAGVSEFIVRVMNILTSRIPRYNKYHVERPYGNSNQNPYVTLWRRVYPIAIESS